MGLKIVINKCYGGFDLSPEAKLRLYELGEKSCLSDAEDYFGGNWSLELSAKTSISEWKTIFTPDGKYVITTNIARDNPNLIKVVEELGLKASGKFAELKIVEIPNDADWEIDEYDGMESIHEKHRIWE